MTEQTQSKGGKIQNSTQHDRAAAGKTQSSYNLYDIQVANGILKIPKIIKEYKVGIYCVKYKSMD